MNLAVLTLTMTTLPWSGESFVSTNPSSATKASGLSLSESFARNPFHDVRIHRSRRRASTRRQLQQSHPAQEPHPSFSSPTVSFLVSYRRSSSLLSAAMLNDPSSSRRGKRNSRGRRSNAADKKGSGWHKRLLGKISFRRQSQGRRGGPESSSSLPSASIEHQEAQMDTVESIGPFKQEKKDRKIDFVARNFDMMTPGEILPIVEVDEKSSPMPKVPSPEAAPKVHGRSKPPAIDSEYFDVSIKSATASNNTKGLVCRLLKNILMERIGQRWPTETPEGLEIDISASPDRYNNILRLLFRGLFRADATLSSDRIVFPTVRFSSIRLQMKQVTLNLLGFFGSNHEYYQIIDANADGNNNGHHKKHQKGRHDQHQDDQQRTTRRGNYANSSTTMKTIGKVRYPKQFDVHIENLTMSRHDLLFSPCVKNGLRRLLVNVLKDRGVSSDSIRITSIDILVSMQKEHLIGSQIFITV